MKLREQLQSLDLAVQHNNTMKAFSAYHAGKKEYIRCQMFEYMVVFAISGNYDILKSLCFLFDDFTDTHDPNEEMIILYNQAFILGIEEGVKMNLWQNKIKYLKPDVYESWKAIKRVEEEE